MTDADISMDQLRSEGLRRWNTDVDIEYKYKTFNGLSVYYGGDRYDSDGTEELIPNARDEMEYMTCTQLRLDINRSVSTVTIGPMCQTVSKGARREVDESSDTSRTDTAELCDTDGHLKSDVWDDMDCPVWIYGLRMVVRHCRATEMWPVCVLLLMRILMTLDLIRMWTPGWSSNGTHGMMHTQGNPKYPHRTRLRLFRQGRRRRCYVTRMIRNLQKRVPVVPAFALLTVRQDIYIWCQMSCLIVFAGTAGPTGRDVRSTNIVND